LFAGMYQLKDEGLQKKNRCHIGKRVIVHGLISEIEFHTLKHSYTNLAMLKINSL
jgi:hypothetical protein